MIQLYHVYLSYGAQSHALRDISFRVDKAEFVFLSGPSGAGKTSLLRLLFLAERCDSGQILLMGENVARIRAAEIPFLRRRVGVVFQDFKLLPERTVAENVAIRLEVEGKSRREIQRKTQESLRLVGLDHKLSSYPLRLSGGEQQRVAIARAIANDPAILLADEPTGNLDPELSRQMYQLFNEIHARGTTVLVASHDLGWAGQNLKRVVRLEQGRIVAGGL